MSFSNQDVSLITVDKAKHKQKSKGAKREVFLASSIEAELTGVKRGKRPENKMLF